MPIHSLNHFFIRSNDLEFTKDFYANILGFEVMPRPDFPFPGYWMGINGSIQVHMGPSNIPNREKYYIGTPPDAVNGQTGVIDHVAFLAEEPNGFIQKFINNKIKTILKTLFLVPARAGRRITIGIGNGRFRRLVSCLEPNKPGFAPHAWPHTRRHRRVQ